MEGRWWPKVRMKGCRNVWTCAVCKGTNTYSTWEWKTHIGFESHKAALRRFHEGDEQRPPEFPVITHHDNHVDNGQTLDDAYSHPSEDTDRPPGQSIDDLDMSSEALTLARLLRQSRISHLVRQEWLRFLRTCDQSKLPQTIHELEKIEAEKIGKTKLVSHQSFVILAISCHFLVEKVRFRSRLLK